MRRFGFILLSLLGGLSLSGAPADDRVTTTVQAILRSLPRLEAGSRGSADQRQCFTCHSQALPVFALLEGKKRGFTIDEENLRRQVRHTFDHLDRGLDLYKEGKGQGGGVLTAGYALWTLDEDGHQTEPVTAAVAQYLLGMQKPNGHWRHRGTRPPTSGSDFTASYVALRGLEHYGENVPRDQLADCKARARTWLLQEEPTETEDLVFRLLSFKYVDVPSEVVAENSRRLLSQQRDDGGWGQISSMPSDPYATATVLVSLMKEGGISPEDPIIQRGIDYLLRTQQTDGTWHVVTRAKPVQVYFESGFPHGVDQFISISASAWATIALLITLPDKPNDANPPFEIVIKQGRIYDGTGGPWYVADIGIRDGKIVKIGLISERDTKNLIDGKGLAVAPGFVDMMGQSATPMLDDPTTALNLLAQGITTINAGEGVSAAPLDGKSGAQRGWTTMAEYFTLLDQRGLPVNVAQSVGHTQVRKLVLGDIDRRPSDEELDQMRALVREGMQAGAIGLSTALIYPPAVYAPTEEIVALARVAGEFGGSYFTHIRNEGDKLLEAIDEAIEIGQLAETPVHIFHLKTAGEANWGKMPLAIAKIQGARNSGQQVTADLYPYVHNGLGIEAFIHPRHFTKGDERFKERLDDRAFREELRQELETTAGWENWYRHVGRDWNRVIIGQTRDRRYADFRGQSIDQIARAQQEDPWDTFFSLVKAEAFALPQSMSEANKILAMKQEFMSFCTDVGPAAGGPSASHPRAFGAFPRIFARYVKELGVLSWERAIAQASAVAANELRVHDRGRIAEGLAADLIVFDPQQFMDHATFANPHTLPSGMKSVLVNGRIVYQNGALTDDRPGRVLRGPGYRRDDAPFSVSSGDSNIAYAQFDRNVRDFMEDHCVPGGAFAVTRGGKLVHAKGFGYANVATHERVTPSSLFRIASVSKPITAVAVLQLAERGKLRLTDRVLEVLDFETEIEKCSESFDKRWRDITIEHLLQHRGGWDRDRSFDPMFQSVRFAREQDVPAPAGVVDVIRAMLRQRLDFDPGERYAYSNFGYALLGRLIERVSGVGYEEYVRTQVLSPLGIQSMRLGGTRLERRAENEVCYYHPERGKSVFETDVGMDVPSPYGGWNLEGMDAHGGWIASVLDLAKFAACFDDPANCPLLTAESIAIMHGRPDGLAGYEASGEPKDVYYSLGWQNRVLDKSSSWVNHWHTGSLPGTATILVRRHDGYNVVAFLNSRTSPKTKQLGNALDKLIGKSINP